MPQTTHQQEIAALLAHREKEGLTYAELAEQTGYSKSTLSWWSWRLRREARVRFAEVDVVKDDQGTERASEAQGQIAICVGQFRVDVPAGFDEDTLARVLALVQQAAC